MPAAHVDTVEHTRSRFTVPGLSSNSFAAHDVHVMHLLSAVVEQSLAWYWPGRHRVHSAHSVSLAAEHARRSKKLDAHVWQERQMASVFAVHAKSVNSPDGQPVQSAHSVLRKRVQPDTSYWSIRHVEHAEHNRSVVGVGEASSNAVPLQLDCALHTLSDVDVGAVTSYCANVHTVRSRQTMSDVGVDCTRMYWLAAAQLVDRSRHTRSVDAVGAVNSYSRRVHTVRSAHPRSVVLVGATASYCCPGVHTELAWHTRSDDHVGAAVWCDAVPHGADTLTQASAAGRWQLPARYCP